MQWVPIALVASIGIPMALLINYLLLFKRFPMLWRLNRETFQRRRERQNSN
jgi:hypothetical protein